MITFSPEIDQIAKAMCELQKSPIVIGKDTPAFKYKYATLDKCVERIFPVMASHGLSVIQPLADVNGEPAIATMIMHTSGQWITTLFPLSKAGMAGVNAAQDWGAAIQYFRRYGLLAALAIPTGEDDDAQSVGKAPTPRAKAPAGKKYKPEDPTPAEKIIAGVGNIDDLQELTDYYKEHRQLIESSPKKDQILAEFTVQRGILESRGPK